MRGMRPADASLHYDSDQVYSRDCWSVTIKKKMKCDLNAPFYKDYKVKNTSTVLRDIRHYDRVHHAPGLDFWVGEDFLFFFQPLGAFFFFF